TADPSTSSPGLMRPEGLGSVQPSPATLACLGRLRSRRGRSELGFADYRVALVTGASSGIGAATVRRLRAEGLEVHAMARDAHRLTALADATACIPHALDVRSTEEIAKLAGSIEVDVMVNNAGQSRQGDVLSTSADDVDQLIDVNLRSILHLTRLFVPGM